MARVAYSLNSYTGAATALTLSGNILSGDTTLTLSGVSSSWSPLGSTGGWYLSVGYGTASEEKIFVPSGSWTYSATGVTFTGVTRGVDNTTAAAQTNGALAVPVITATDISEANRAVNALYGGGTAGQLVISGTLTVSGSIINPILQGSYETVIINSTTALSGTNPATLNTASGSFYYNTLSPSGSYTVAITGAPTVAGRSATYALLVNNGATAYLPQQFTINGIGAAATAALPAHKSTTSGITTYYQGGTLWSSADASELDSYTFTVICTATGTPNSYTLLAGLTKF